MPGKKKKDPKPVGVLGKGMAAKAAKGLRRRRQMLDDPEAAFNRQTTDSNNRKR